MSENKFGSKVGEFLNSTVIGGLVPMTELFIFSATVLAFSLLVSRSLEQAYELSKTVAGLVAVVIGVALELYVLTSPPKALVYRVPSYVVASLVIYVLSALKMWDYVGPTAVGMLTILGAIYYWTKDRTQQRADEAKAKLQARLDLQQMQQLAEAEVANTIALAKAQLAQDKRAIKQSNNQSISEPIAPIKQPSQSSDDTIGRITRLYDELEIVQAKEVVELLGVSHSTAKRIMGKAVELGVYDRVGNGRSTKYVRNGINPHDLQGVE